MALWELYGHPYRRIYKASFCSKATLFLAITFLLTIICPLLIAYRSQGFWLKTNTYRETPSIRFKYDYVIKLQGDRPDAYLLWTSFPGLAQLEDGHLRVPVLRVYEPDQDKDGKADHLQLSLAFPMNADDRVKEVEMVLLFDYRLELQSRFRMQTMAYGRYESYNEATSLDVNADMRIVQKMPLWSRGIDARFDTPVVNRTSLDASQYRISNFLDRYRMRNISTELDSVTSSWTLGYAGVSGTFRVNFRINYVTETFEYWTGFWELIKWAWIQYLSVLLVFIFVMKRVNEYVIRNRLVTTVPVADHQLMQALTNRGNG